MSYRTEFPGYELDVDIPEGFEDSSRYDDGMPSFSNYHLGILLMVDYADPERRLIPRAGRFSLLQLEPGDAGEVGELLLETDSYEHVLEFIRKFRPRRASADG